MVYGVMVTSDDGASDVEAMFSTEAAAFVYAQTRSGHGECMSSKVASWVVDRPGERMWLMLYQGGEQEHRVRRIRPPS